MHDVRNAVHDDFQRNGDLLLDLLGRNSRPLGDDLDVVVRHVGIGFDGKLVEGDRAAGDQQQSEGKNEERSVQGKIDESANHLLLHRVLQRQRVLQPPAAPGLMPETISCMLPGSMAPAATSRR